MANSALGAAETFARPIIMASVTVAKNVAPDESWKRVISLIQGFVGQGSEANLPRPNDIGPGSLHGNISLHFLCTRVQSDLQQEKFDSII